MSEALIHQNLSPRVAVFSSADVDEIAKENGLYDFPSLLRPFENSVENLSVRTSQLESKSCSTFSLRFDPLSSFLIQHSRPRASRNDSGIPTSTSDSSNQTVSSSNSQPQSGLSSTTSSSSIAFQPKLLSSARPEQLLDEVSAHLSGNSKRWELQGWNELLDKEGKINEDVLKKPIEEITPWFADFRDMILSNRLVSEHETFSHPTAVILAISSQSPDPLNALASLHEASTSSQAFLQRPYMDPNILRYYVLLHDVGKSGSDLSESLSLLESIKKTYGLHCCLLPINSNPDSSLSSAAADLSSLWTKALQPRGHARVSSVDSSHNATSLPEYGKRLSEEDVKRLKGFVRELTAQSLVPFMERCVQQWNEQLAASRRGLTGKLFGAGRKFFGSKSSGSAAAGQAVPPGYDSTNHYYPFASIEAQTRRLADFAFMTRDYQLAAAMYDIGRKDYGSDKAVKYSAGATEMFGLSHLMMMLTSRSPPIDVDSYLFQASYEYSASSRLGSSSPSQIHSLRATLLYYEAYRALSHYRSAPVALLRASGSSEEVFSALLLEQAALSDLKLPRRALRKHAVHLVMAAHRYQDCGQKHLSLKCYAQAARFYKGKAWTLVEDHVEHELGRQAYNDGNSEQAIEHYVTLLRSSEGANVAPHQVYLEEFLTALKYSGRDVTELVEERKLQLPSSFFDSSKSSIQIYPSWETEGGSIARGTADESLLVDDDHWTPLEERFLATGYPDNQLSQTGKKRKRPLTLAKDSDENVASTDDLISLSVVAVNPLNTSITLNSVKPIVSLARASDPDTFSADEIEVETLDEIHLGPEEERIVSFSIRSSKLCSLQVTGIAFNLSGVVPFTQSLKKQGRRLNATREQRLTPTYAPDRSLLVKVREPKPSLKVRLESSPSDLLVGEEWGGNLILQNVGSVSLRDLRVIVDDSTSLQVLGLEDQDAKQDSEGDHLVLRNDLDLDLPRDIELPSGILEAGASIEVPIAIRGVSAGLNETRCLFVFESENGEETLSGRYSHQFFARSVLDCSAVAQPSRARELLYSLSLEASNISQSGENINVDSVEILSPQWAASSKSPPLNFGSISPMQMSFATALLDSASPAPPGSKVTPIAELSFSVAQLKTLLSGRDIDRSARPAITSLHRSHLKRSSKADSIEADEMDTRSSSPFLRSSRMAWKKAILSQQFPSMSSSDRERIFPLYEPRDVDILVRWSLSSSCDSPSIAPQKGQLFIFGLSLGPRHNQLRELTGGGGAAIRSMYAQTAREKKALLDNLLASRLSLEEDPLLVRVKLESREKHDFNKGALRLPVTFVVQNLSKVISANFTVQLQGPEADSLNEEGQSSFFPSIPYVSRLTHRGSLSPRSVQQFTVHALVKEAGAFGLGGWTSLVQSVDVETGEELETFRSRVGSADKVVKIDQL